MTKHKKHNAAEEQHEQEVVNNEAAEQSTAEGTATETTQPSAEPSIEDQLADYKDRYIRLNAEFDNFRKRTRKEREDLIKTAGESILVNILPVVDDFDRAIKSMDSATDIQAVKDGVTLIANKFNEFLKRQGVVEVESMGLPFDTDLHEAITQIPAPSEEMKGKVLDVVQKGYRLNEKVIRYSKVVIGE